MVAVVLKSGLCTYFCINVSTLSLRKSVHPLFSFLWLALLRVAPPFCFGKASSPFASGAIWFRVCLTSMTKREAVSGHRGEPERKNLRTESISLHFVVGCVWRICFLSFQVQPKERSTNPRSGSSMNILRWMIPLKRRRSLMMTCCGLSGGGQNALTSRSCGLVCLSLGVFCCVAVCFFQAMADWENIMSGIEQAAEDMRKTGAYLKWF